MFKAYTKTELFLEGLKEGLLENIGEYEEDHENFFDVRLFLKTTTSSDGLIYEGSYRDKKITASVENEYSSIKDIHLETNIGGVISFADAVRLDVGNQIVFSQGFKNKNLAIDSLYTDIDKFVKVVQNNTLFDKINYFSNCSLSNAMLSFVAMRDGTFVYKGIYKGKNITCVLKDPITLDNNFERDEKLIYLIWKANSVYVHIGGEIVLKTGCYKNEFNS